MKKENVVDLRDYREDLKTEQTSSHSTMSDELITAIQNLINRLKEGPLPQS